MTTLGYRWPCIDVVHLFNCDISKHNIECKILALCEGEIKLVIPFYGLQISIPEKNVCTSLVNYA